MSNSETAIWITTTMTVSKMNSSSFFGKPEVLGRRTKHSSTKTAYV